MPALTLAKAIPDQVINEGAVYKPLDFKQFMTIEDARAQVRFTAELQDGRPLPPGLICTSEGVLSGIPAKGSVGSYVVMVKVDDIEGATLTALFNLLIKPVNVTQPHDLLRDMKAQVWAAVGKDQPVPVMPDLGNIYNWPVTAYDLYYLLERFAYLTIWDSNNAAPAGKPKLLNLPGVSAHFNVFDRGSCIVGAPKDLYTYARTPHDALVTARAMADEVHKRGWTIEFSGFDKMARIAWVRLQVLGKQHGKYTQVLHFMASLDDGVIYNREIGAVDGMSPKPGVE